MPRPQIAQRTYHLSSYMLFYECIAALGHMRARIEAEDNERGTIVATIGEGVLAPSSELSLQLTPIDAERTELSAVWRARAWGGDRGLLAAFLQLLDSSVSRR